MLRTTRQLNETAEWTPVPPMRRGAVATTLDWGVEHHVRVAESSELLVTRGKGSAKRKETAEGPTRCARRAARREPLRMTIHVRAGRAPRGIALPRRQTNGINNRCDAASSLPGEGAQKRQRGASGDGKTSERRAYGTGAMQSKTESGSRRPRRAAAKSKQMEKCETRMSRQEGEKTSERDPPPQGSATSRSAPGPVLTDRGGHRCAINTPAAAAVTREKATGLKTREETNTSNQVRD